MSEIENGVAAHYGGPDLLAVILGVATGPDGTLRSEILERIDEFHIGGSAATERLLDGMDLAQGARLLDIGSGVGGPARRAARRGLEVTGIDLTERFVAAASDLTSRVPALRVQFRQCSALALPFADASFDAAMMLHVGINIADKPRLMAEVARVLRPGSVFGVYDPMRLDDAPPTYPLPWANGRETDFLDTPDSYRRAAASAGLNLTAEIPRAGEARAFFTMMRENAAEALAAGLPPPLGIGLVMGEDASLKLANITAAVMQGHVVPVELHFRKPA